VFPGSVVKGCVFHLTQRIYRKIQAEGLATAYMQKGDKYEFLRKLMSLPYLPVEQITAAFDRLKIVAEEAGGPVLNVVEYMDRTWIRGSVWNPSNWSVFRELVRTNNDLEGWHRRLNARAGHPNLGFYKLIILLKEEASTVDIQIRLVSENLLCKIRRKKYAQLHGRLEEAWDKYEEDELSTTALLRTISHISGLGPTTAANHILPEDE
jgi:hypothetical protein